MSWVEKFEVKIPIEISNLGEQYLLYKSLEWVKKTSVVYGDDEENRDVQLEEDRMNGLCLEILLTTS